MLGVILRVLLLVSYCVLFFWHQMILGKQLPIFPSVSYVSMLWTQLEGCLCSLPSSFPLSLSLLASWPPSNSALAYGSASLSCLHPLHTCIVPAHTMTATLLTMKVFFSNAFLMSPQGTCRSNQRWQRKCNPGVRKLERMQKCLFIVWKGHWPTLLPLGWWVGRKCRKCYSSLWKKTAHVGGFVGE